MSITTHRETDGNGTKGNLWIVTVDGVEVLGGWTPGTVAQAKAVAKARYAEVAK